MLSRSKRFENAKELVRRAVMEMEELKSELDDWLDNMPENLQGSQKAGELEEAIDQLDEIIISLEETEAMDIMFPGMY